MGDAMRFPCAAAFQQAVENFKSSAGLNHEEMYGIQTTSLLTLQKYLARLQKKQQTSRSMVYLKRLQPFLNTMQQLFTLLGNSTGVSAYSAYVWGPTKFLLEACQTPESLSSLLDAYLEIGFNIPRFTQYHQDFHRNPYLWFVSASLFRTVMQFHLEAIQILKHPSSNMIFHALWQRFKPRITYSGKCMNEYKAFFETQATGLENSPNPSQWEVQAQFDELQSDLERLAKEFQDTQEEVLNHRRLSILQWLCAVDSDLRQQNEVKRRQGGTGEWLLRDSRFEQWMNPDHCTDPLLWLNGIPGAGKTVLASLVIQEAQKLPDTMVTFFYCKHGDEHKNGFLNVAKGIIAQALAQDNSLIPYIYGKVCESGAAMLSNETLAKELLEVALKSHRRTYVILDGLDEYSRDDRKEISSYFRTMVESIPKENLGSLRCLFVSQDDGSARKDFSMLSQIKVTPADNRGDIEAYCRLWHGKIEEKFGRLSNGTNNITNVVTARAQGMFLFAKLVTWNLYEQATKEDLEKELDPYMFPNGLEEAYERIIERILAPAAAIQSRYRNTLKLLGWLAIAKRPLKWYEIQGAMSIDLESETVNAEETFKEDCKDVCASLVEVSSDESVALVHSTTKLYLINKGYVNSLEVECNLANLCLGYLTCAQFEVDTPTDTVEAALFSGFYSFTDYAICFWAIHLEASIGSLKTKYPRHLSDLAQALEEFLALHWTHSEKSYVVPKALRKRLSPLEQHTFFDKACQAIVAQIHQLRSTSKGPSDDEVIRLPAVLSRIRNTLEGLSTSFGSTEDKRELLAKHYGPNWFKCPRPNCHFFHGGFLTKNQLEQHVSKHERAFMCQEDGCPQSIFGCTTRKDLQIHLLICHGVEINEDDHKFPKETEIAAKIRTEQCSGKFQCDTCQRRFVRPLDLKEHKRSHTGERPFCCSVCGKGFRRKYEQQRHEVLHTGKKPFACRGVLENGKEWGCGKEFARAGSLQKHFSSRAGQVCRRPLQENNATERGPEM